MFWLEFSALHFYDDVKVHFFLRFKSNQKNEEWRMNIVCKHFCLSCDYFVPAFVSTFAQNDFAEFIFN